MAEGLLIAILVQTAGDYRSEGKSMTTSRTTPSDTSSQPEAPIWTWPYVMVCLATFLGYVNYALFNPTLPLFVDGLGASGALVGLTYAVFSGASFLIRPFVGKLVDTGSPRIIMAVGSLLVAIGSLPYLIPHLGPIFVGRFIQGIGWSGLNVGSVAIVAGLAPAHRRGEASGYFQTAIRIATGLLPSVGIWLLAASTFSSVVVLAAATALLSAFFAVRIREAPRPAQVRHTGNFFQGLVDSSALYPGVLLFLVNLAFPAAVIFIPLYARTQGINGVAIFFLAQGITGIISQATMGRLSDHIGRGPTIALGLAITMTGLVMLSQAHTTFVLSAGGAAYLLGFGIVNPALMALVIDRAQPSRMGAAMATYSLSFQLGNAVGAPLAGLIIGWTGYPSLYLASVLPQFAAFALVAMNWNSSRRRARQAEQAVP